VLLLLLLNLLFNLLVLVLLSKPGLDWLVLCPSLCLLLRLLVLFKLQSAVCVCCCCCCCWCCPQVICFKASLWYHRWVRISA
jgi:hypothetical protein